MNKADAEFVLIADQLSRSSGRVWSEFLSEFSKRTDRVKNQMVQSAPEQMQINAGRAREAVDLLDLLSNCRGYAEGVHAARKKQEK